MAIIGDSTNAPYPMRTLVIPANTHVSHVGHIPPVITGIESKLLVSVIDREGNGAPRSTDEHQGRREDDQGVDGEQFDEHSGGYPDNTFLVSYIRFSQTSDRHVSHHVQTIEKTRQDTPG